MRNHDVFEAPSVELLEELGRSGRHFVALERQLGGRHTLRAFGYREHLVAVGVVVEVDLASVEVQQGEEKARDRRQQRNGVPLGRPDRSGFDGQWYARDDSYR